MGFISAIIGWLSYHLGLRTDAASATGSLHAKLADVKDTLASLSVIKSVQRGVITINNITSSATATISAVTTTKTQLNFLGASTTGSTALESNPRIVLTNGTTVTATRGNSADVTITVSYEVIEYY